MATKTAPGEVSQFRPGVTYVAGAAQMAAGAWMVSLPNAWPIGLLAVLLGTMIMILARRGEATLLWVTAVVPMVVGGLFLFSGGLLVVFPAAVVVVAVAVDAFLGCLRA